MTSAKKTEGSKGFPDGEREAAFVLLFYPRLKDGWRSRGGRCPPLTGFSQLSGQSARGFLGWGEDLWRCG